MFNKISSMLGKAWDFGGSLIKPLKNHVSNGWESLKNGASKVGQFVNNNHEAIGSILSGIGNIVSKMPGSPIKQKLENFGNAASNVGYAASGVGNMFHRMTRPSNLPRQQFSNNLNSKISAGPPQPTNQRDSQNSPPPTRSII